MKSLIPILGLLLLNSTTSVAQVPDGISGDEVVPSVVQPKNENWTNSLGIEFIAIPEQKGRLAAFPVRVQDYKLFVEETRHTWPRPEFPQESDHPAVNVNWEDAIRFCQWLTAKERKAGLIGKDAHYRLPYEEEWMAAQQLGTTENQSTFPWGEEWPPPPEFGNYGNPLASDPHPHTSPVQAFPPNSLGFYDLSGNVWEWCMDRFQDSHDLRVLRGGSWRMRDASDLTVTSRVGNVLHLRLSSYGFRLYLVGASIP